MNIQHFNSLLDGGAATAARRLHVELLRRGHESRFYYLSKLGSPPEFDPSYRPAKWSYGGLASWLKFRIRRTHSKRAMRRRPSGHEVFNSPYGGPHTPWPTADHRASNQDVIHLHWIAKFLDQPSFFGSLSNQQPVVWTLHDMNALTGGCHFSDGCDRYTQGCGGCPQLPSRLSSISRQIERSGEADAAAADLSRQYFLTKQAALANVNLHIAAPSRWLLRCAQASPILAAAKSFHHVPYGIALDDYYPMDRRDARARLGIDPATTLVCFGAMDVSARRKGGRHLVRALSHLADMPGVEGLVFGSGQLPPSDLPMPRLHHVGPVRGLLAQRAVYSAADVFVLPSLEDNLPLTGLEAMACGTAVVGFDAGGIPDYVRPGQTGLLARTGDGDDLGLRLRDLAGDVQRTIAMGRRARAMIEREYAAAHEAAAYESLYESLGDSLGGELIGQSKQVSRRAA